MAKSRLLSQEIAEDSKIARLSDEAALTYAFTIPFLDRDGLCSGKPSWVGGRALQERPHLQHMVGKYIGEWVAQGLVIRYEGNDGPVLFFPGFRKHNANLPYERESVSKFPPPPGYHRGKVGLIPNDPELAGRLAQSFDARSLYAIALTEAATDKRTLEDSLGLNTSSHNKVTTYSRPSRDLVATSSRPGREEVEVEVKEKEKGREEKESNNNGADAPAPSLSLTDHPLIKAFHEQQNRYPNKEQMAEIVRCNPPIGDWIRAIHAWALAGHKPTNVQGMLDWAFEPSRYEVSAPAAKSAGKGADSKGSYLPEEYSDIILGRPKDDQP